MRSPEVGINCVVNSIHNFKSLAGTLNGGIVNTFSKVEIPGEIWGNSLYKFFGGYLTIEKESLLYLREIVWRMSEKIISVHMSNESFNLGDIDFTDIVETLQSKGVIKTHDYRTKQDL